jgi:predicted DNA-binding transcriptional regulator AlpA
VEDDILLDETEVAARTGYSVKWVQTARAKGGFIPFCKIGGRTVRYRKSELDAWIASHQSFTSTSEVTEARRTGRAAR